VRLESGERLDDGDDASFAHHGVLVGAVTVVR
jgi:hypothetical protein